MLVSIIIPAYNREKVILSSVKSVLNQNEEDIEVIVVDDCSSDNTLSVLRKIEDARLKVIPLEKNSGACVARNTGIKAARGEYIAFQDSDDVWHQDKLKKQLLALNNYKADVCFCAFNKFTESNEKATIYPTLSDGIVPYHILASYSQASTQTIIAKREVFDEILFDAKLPRLQDFDWMIRAAKGNRVVFVSEPLVDVYVQSDSISMSNNKLIEAYRIIIEKYPEMKDESLDVYVRWIEWYAKAKILDGQCDKSLYKELFTCEKTVENFVKYCFAELGLLEPFMRQKRKRVTRKR
nr:glycosyltransferase family 2 protein [uncultured Blautia sp.]